MVSLPPRSRMRNLTVSPSSRTALTFGIRPLPIVLLTQKKRGSPTRARTAPWIRNRHDQRRHHDLDGGQVTSPSQISRKLLICSLYFPPPVGCNSPVVIYKWLDRLLKKELYENHNRRNLCQNPCQICLPRLYQFHLPARVAMRCSHRRSASARAHVPVVARGFLLERPLPRIG